MFYKKFRPTKIENRKSNLEYFSNDSMHHVIVLSQTYHWSDGILILSYNFTFIHHVPKLITSTMNFLHHAFTNLYKIQNNKNLKNFKNYNKNKHFYVLITSKCSNYYKMCRFIWTISTLNNFCYFIFYIFYNLLLFL